MEFLSVEVYRHNTTLGGIMYDCTNGGITSRHDSLFLFWDCDRNAAKKYCEEKGIDTDKCLILIKRELWGENHSYAEPLIRPENKVGGMMGGNFVYTCDSRLYKLNGLTCATPIPVHDRFEGQREYDALSF